MADFVLFLSHPLIQYQLFSFHPTNVYAKLAIEYINGINNMKNFFVQVLKLHQGDTVIMSVISKAIFLIKHM